MAASLPHVHQYSAKAIAENIPPLRSASSDKLQTQSFVVGTFGKGDGVFAIGTIRTIGAAARRGIAVILVLGIVPKQLPQYILPLAGESGFQARRGRYRVRPTRKEVVQFLRCCLPSI